MTSSWLVFDTDTALYYCTVLNVQSYIKNIEFDYVHTSRLASIHQHRSPTSHLHLISSVDMLSSLCIIIITLLLWLIYVQVDSTGIFKLTRTYTIDTILCTVVYSSKFPTRHSIFFPFGHMLYLCLSTRHGSVLQTEIKSASMYGAVCIYVVYSTFSGAWINREWLML